MGTWLREREIGLTSVVFHGRRNLVSQLVQHERIETTVPKVRSMLPCLVGIRVFGFGVEFLVMDIGAECRPCGSWSWNRPGSLLWNFPLSLRFF